LWAYDPRVKNPLLTAVLLALAVATAAPAAADADQDYLDMLHNTYDMPNATGEMVKLGHAICADLRGGASAADEAAALYRAVPKISEKAAGEVVSAAQIKLCPDTT
jgi:hypothetical protein